MPFSSGAEAATSASRSLIDAAAIGSSRIGSPVAITSATPSSIASRSRIESRRKVSTVHPSRSASRTSPGFMPAAGGCTRTTSGSTALIASASISRSEPTAGTDASTARQ